MAVAINRRKEREMKSITRLLRALLLTALFVPSAIGGNREMVENRVRELHDINRQVIEQLPPEMTKSGTVDIRATVSPRQGTVRIEDMPPQAVPMKQLSPTNPSAGDQCVPFKVALARYLEKPAEIVGLRGPPETEEYASFHEAIRRLTGNAGRK
jgi:hypothetical protein